MKLAKREPVVLHEGDRCAVTITHNIKINGDDAWVKYEIESTLQPGEAMSELDNRLIGHATSQVIDVAARAAQNVLNLKEHG